MVDKIDGKTCYKTKNCRITKLWLN